MRAGGRSDDEETSSQFFKFGDGFFVFDHFTM